MLTFYPEFEADCIVDNEIILCLDCSNSMKVNITCEHLAGMYAYISMLDEFDMVHKLPCSSIKHNH